MHSRKTSLLAVWLLLCLAAPGVALITGGAGNKPLSVPDWPKGAADLANLKTRIAWWEGPPFGGGQYHFEYRGTTDDLQEAINLFVKVDSKRKRIVVQEGKKKSFWLSTVQRPDDKPNVVDWQLVVWVPQNWIRLKDARHGLLPPGEEGDSPATVMYVHLTDRIDWSKLEIPKALTIDDQRLEANGIAPEDGGAIRGRIVDIAGKPIAKATITLGKDGTEGKATTNTKGKFLIIKIPEGSHPIQVSATGYASRDARYVSVKKTSYQETEVRLAEATHVTVRAVDTENRPLKGVSIRISNCQDRQGNHYPLAGTQQFETNEKGEFALSDIPAGKLKFSSRTKEYYYNSVLNEHDTDEKIIVLKLVQTGSVLVVVANADADPVTSKYMIEVGPEGGGGVGSWGGSANVRSDGTVLFKSMPPGRYVVTGRPNPGRVSDTTDPITVEVKGGEQEMILVIAK